MSLSQRTGSVFDAAHDVAFGVSRSGAAPLAEFFQLIQCEFAYQRQCGIEHRRHVSRVEEETVATFPRGVLGVVH